MIDNGIPPEDLSITARRIRLVERPHRRRWTEALTHGALRGGAVGLLVGLFLGVVEGTVLVAGVLVLATWGAIVGAVVGAFGAFVVHVSRDRGRRYDVTPSFQAEQFDVSVSSEHADRARRIASEVS